MRVIQLLPTIAYGDAVGNDTLAIQELLREMGYHDTAIYAENIDPRLPAGTACHVSQLPQLAQEDVILYHGSTGTDLNDQLPQLPGRKVMIYHNITPSQFFQPYSQGAVELTAHGIDGITRLADRLDYCIADSEFNKRDLLRMGYTCPIDVCPILIPFEDYAKTPDRAVLRQYSGDGYVNLLFVGRVSPNKRQEDVIRAFYFYHKFFEPKSRLFLVGAYGGMEPYYQRLTAYVDRLGLTDSVIFPGHIKFNAILAYYKLADVFLCMSEHEGFCVPLTEAMYFDIPIVARATTAIPDTLGGGGVLLPDNDPRAAARQIHRLVQDQPFREATLQKQRQRLADFSHERVSARLRSLLEGFLSQPQDKRPRVIQAVTAVSRGDGIGNDVCAIREMLVEEGIPSPLCVELPSQKAEPFCQDLSLLESLRDDDVVLYHHGTGTCLAERFADLSCKKVLRYHNITPPHFFAPYNKGAAQACQWGLDNVKYMSKRVDRCIAVSAFNKEDLRRAGYTCPIDVCPSVIPFGDYVQTPDRATVEQYSDGRTNVVFVGRVAPNKKFEDVISAFAAYKHSDPAARLILAGSYDQGDAYYEALTRHVDKLKVEDVIFTGRISFPEILAYYKVADIFLCMSEHEGFCVPLVEAMYFDVPIVAYASCAVPETLGGSGVLLDTKEPKAVAAAMTRLREDGTYREKVLKDQRARLKDFHAENEKRILLEQINRILGEEK